METCSVDEQAQQVGSALAWKFKGTLDLKNVGPRRLLRSSYVVTT